MVIDKSVRQYVLLLILLAGCTRSEGISTPPATHTNISPHPIVTPQATARPLTPCTNLESPSILDASASLPGTLLFWSPPNIVVLDGPTLSESLVEYVIKGGYIDYFGLSPDSQWLFYAMVPPAQENPLELYLISATGERIMQQLTLPAFLLPDADIWYIPSSAWIGNNYLLINLGKYSRENTSEMEAIALFDPFVGTWERAIFENLPGRYDESGVALSPDLTRALYITGSTLGVDNQLVLWDIGAEKELWSQKFLAGPPYEQLVDLAPSVWSKDSSFVAFPISANDYRTSLYIVDRDGIQQEVRPGAKESASRGLNWSPDGRYLAFVSYVTNDSDTLGVIVYDRVANQVLEICTLGTRLSATHNIEAGTLVWSPDSRYLVFGMGEDWAQEDNRLLLLDIFTGEVTLLKQGKLISLIGWSTAESWVLP